MIERLNYASCGSPEEAKVIVFGANTCGAGYSQSFLGHSKLQRKVFSADAIRSADNESPSLPENFCRGGSVYDVGNIHIDQESAWKQSLSVKQEFSRIFSKKKVGVCLGGDHLIKYGALEAVKESFTDCYIIYLDAHPDTKAESDLTFASILHHGFDKLKLSPEQVHILGMRQFNDLEAAGINHWKPNYTLGSEFGSRNLIDIYESIWSKAKAYSNIFISIDLDGLEPKDAPAVEAPYPGGPGLNQVITLLKLISKDFNMVGMDISEFIPEVDTAKLTALTASRIMKEFCSLLK